MHKTANATSSTNFWSCTENNQNNAWYINFSSGNTNNNNKYNTNYCRAVAALGREYIIEWIVAFDDCCTHKKSTLQCTLYRLRAMDLIDLALEVYYGVYTPSASDAFCVVYPKLREIFAAAFRDRIVQHWIVLRIGPLLEARHQAQGNVSYNCRKNFGTLAAVQRLKEMIEGASKGYTIAVTIGRYDINSFFMSIDVRILWGLLEPFVRANYRGNDIERLIYVLKITVFHRPAENCHKKGNVGLFDKLKKSKSLFHALIYIGMAIGNITSQLLANFYLSFFDEFMLSLCAKYGAQYIRFVDDFSIIHPDRKIVGMLAKEAGQWLLAHLHLILHPDKIYMQDARHGVLYVGTMIKPSRTYLSNRTFGRFFELLNDIEMTCYVIANRGVSEAILSGLAHLVCGANSYLGFARHNASYNMRGRAFGNLVFFWKVCYATQHYNTIKIYKQYQISNYLYEAYLLKRTPRTRRNRACNQSCDLHNGHQFLGQGGAGSR